jgi:hypothetical protein
MLFAVYTCYCAETLSIHMEDFKTLPTDKLLDLLTEHTSNYIRMVKDGCARCTIQRYSACYYPFAE